MQTLNVDDIIKDLAQYFHPESLLSKKICAIWHGMKNHVL